MTVSPPSLRYAVLHHTGVAVPHFDLLFETYPGSVLTTWRAAAWPVTADASVTRLPDHRRLYLTFEGELTGRRGRVERVAGGTCAVEVGENATWTIRLLSGASPATFILRPAGEGDVWLLVVGDAN